MTRGQFEQAFDGLPKRRREVLELFLVGMDDEEIARTLQVKAVTVRSQLRNICDAFGLENEFPDDRTSRRGDLIDLFQQYKPELVKEEEKRSQFDPNFVGREEAIADLNALIENGAKCIQILSAGGQGKTTLAWKFLKTRFAEKDILYFPIGKETKDIASIESLVEERLRILGEEPGREFLVSLERLRERLTHQPMGVLIDNLEPALDESNQFVAQHRSYVELFKQVLLSPEVRSLTLITSRAPLQEGLAIQKYTLKPLSLEAWEQYFQHRKIVTDSTVLQEVCGTYNGNALAMEILCSAIRDEEDYENNLAAYWTDNKTEEGVYIEDSVLNLIREQFKNLERLKPNAYKLLCRMGCFRYQDVPTVPEEGLFCLLWDVDKSQHKRVVKVLKNRALVNVVDGEYRLHPVVRSEALARLRETEDWERVNQVAAEFWTKSVKTVQTIDDILKAFEAYLHYLNIHAFEEAGVVITFERSNEWSVEEPLGRSLYRIGQLKKAIVSISYILDKIQSYHCRASLYNILGDLYWLVGNLKKSIECHNDSEKISLQALNKERKDQIRKICSIKSPFEIFIPIATFNIGLCKIDMWEIEDSLILFEKCKYLLK
ncbi:MAG: sigma factor-like helix-turn-helix DNA-binding protein, partial [Cyanobacteria bacterium P01_E01_bin.42]